MEIILDLKYEQLNIRKGCSSKKIILENGYFAPKEVVLPIDKRVCLSKAISNKTSFYNFIPFLETQIKHPLEVRERKNEILNEIQSYFKENMIALSIGEILDYTILAYDIIENASMEYNSAIAFSFAKVEIGSEKSCRHFATYKLAELLGVPSIVTASTEAILVLPNRKIYGYFINKANGYDITAIDENNVGKYREFCSQKIFYDAGFCRELSTLHILDFIAGQTDRNPSNIFYKYNKNSRTFYGIQGIDNDIAFGLADMNELSNDKLGNLEDLMFVDEQVYMRINKIKLCDLERNFKGILNNMEIDALINRFLEVRNHVNSKMNIVPNKKWYENIKSFQSDSYVSVARKGLQFIEETIHKNFP